MLCKLRKLEYLNLNLGNNYLGENIHVLFKEL